MFYMECYKYYILACVPDLETALCIVSRPVDVALSKEGRIFVVTGFALLRQESMIKSKKMRSFPCGKKIKESVRE